MSGNNDQFMFSLSYDNVCIYRSKTCCDNKVNRPWEKVFMKYFKTFLKFVQALLKQLKSTKYEIKIDISL